MASTSRFINDIQWPKIAPLLPPEKPGSLGGRPRAANREVLEDILWILRTGAPWQDLPNRYPSPSTCWCRLKVWEEQELWLKIWRTFLSLLDAEELLDWEEAFIDTSFALAKKGATASAPLKGARARSGWWWSTSGVFLWEVPLPQRRRRK